MLKCIGYRFTSYHGIINGSQVDSDKLIFSYISNEESSLNGWESHQITLKVNDVERVFGVKVMRDQLGCFTAVGLNEFVNQAIIISCSFNANGRANISKIFVDPTSQKKS